MTGIQTDAGNVQEINLRKNKRAQLLFDDPSDIEDWNSIKHFKRKWQKQIKDYQSRLLPIHSISTKHEIQKWMEYLPNDEHPEQSRVRCRICYKHFDEFNFFEQYRSKLGSKEGMLHDNYHVNQEKIAQHASQSIHQQIIQALQQRESETNLPNKFQKLQEKQLQGENSILRGTANIFRMVYAEQLLNIPFSSHATMVKLTELNGAIESHHHYEARGAQRILLFISNHMHDTLIGDLKSRRGHDPISLILDGSTDASNNHYIICFFQLLENNFPVIHFYKLIPLEDDETAKGIFAAIKNQWDVDGITTFMKENLVAYASDGAPVVKTAFKRILEEFLGRNVHGIHCLAHRAQFAYKRALKDVTYVYHLESMVNQIYVMFYSHSHKTKAHFRRNFADFKLREFT